MSRYIRPKVPGAAVFFTVALERRGADTLVRRVDVLRRAVRDTRAERPFRIDAFVVLPDHLHAVWTLPEGDRDYGTRWGAIKARFTRRVGFHPTNRTASKVAKGDAGLWQRRFWEHTIRDAADFDAHMRYCWLNPVKHGLVGQATDWPFSSIHRDMRHGLVPPDIANGPKDGAFGEPLMVG